MEVKTSLSGNFDEDEMTCASIINGRLYEDITISCKPGTNEAKEMILLGTQRYYGVFFYEVAVYGKAS